MTDLWKDIKYGCRMLVKSPSFTFVAVLSLALGIGFNTTIFSAVDSVLLRPKAGMRADRLVEVYLSDSSGYPYNSSSYPDAREYRAQTDVFSGVVSYQSVIAHYRDGDESEYLMGEVVSGNYFELLSIPISAGRALQTGDDESPGGHPVIVISEGFWQSRLGGAADVIGQELDLNGRSYEIVGVAAEPFTGSLPGLRMVFWAPTSMVDHLMPSSMGQGSRLERRTSRACLVRARLAPGVTLERAQAQMDLLSARLQETYPDAYGERTIQLLPSSEVRLHPMVDGALFPVAGVLMAIVGLVLLIACANVANMQLARASARRGEVSIRLALGSTRFRLIRQLLTESLLLSTMGGALGLLIAHGATRLLLAFRPPIPVPLALDLTLNTRVLAFTLLVAVLTGIAFGLVPALQSSRTNLIPGLKSAERRGGERRRRFGLRGLLVVGQVAVSLLLLVAASLMLKSVGNAQKIDPGFEVDSVALVSTHLGLHGYTEATGQTFYADAVERIAALPEVETAAVSDKVPLGAMVRTRSMAPEGAEPEREGEWPELDVASVSPGYFEVLDIPLLAGRDFLPSDNQDAPGVAIVNEAAARRFWPGTDPIGKRLATGRVGNLQYWEVIGVARDTKVRTLGEEPRPQTYFAFQQDYSSLAYVLVRARPAAPDADSVLQAARRELMAMDSALAFFESRTMTENMSIMLFPVRMGAMLLGVFGALALGLASIGLYGVIAYSVSQRTHEIGLRMALGARSQDVLLMVTRQGLRLVLTGTAIGLILAVAATRVLSGVLYGVSATDVVTFAWTAFVLVAVALLANWIPARRAANVNPITALHYE